VTPYQSVRSDLSGLLGAIGTGIHPRTQKSAKKLTRPQKRRTH